MKIAYGIAETMGHRRTMEDTHAVADHTEQGVFSAEVYDGHAGLAAAALAVTMITPLFLGEDVNGELGNKNGFTAEAVRQAYLAADRYISSRQDESGAAAAHIYLSKTGFIAANAGDCRIVAGEVAGLAMILTKDHKPDVTEEKARIEAEGGTVVTLDVARVQGSLSMSRALGDGPLKPYVTAEPRVVEGMFGRRNDFLILACDGLWDVVTPEEAVTVARSTRGPQEAADKLCTLALSKGSRDNITIVVIDLRAYTAGSIYDRLHIARVLDRAAEGFEPSIT